MLRPARSVLAVESGRGDQRCVAGELRPALDVWGARSVEQALELLAERSFDAVVTELALPDGDGLMVLVAATSFSPRSVRLLVWEHARDDARTAEGLEELLHGALARPWPAGALREKVLRLLSPAARLGRGPR